MKTLDLNLTVTSDALNESMFKKFGARVNLEKYTREQLENYRNLLRTKVSQVEASSGFNELLSDETHQKDKHMLELLNTRIKEMLGEAKKELSNKLSTSVEKEVDRQAGEETQRSDEGKTMKTKKSKKNDGNLANNYPPYDKVTRGDVVAGRLGKDEMGGKNKQAAKKSVKKPVKKSAKKKVSESARLKSSYGIILEGLRRYISEDEEGKAKDITAGADMVNDFTSWMQRIGQFQTKSMIELADSIKANFSKEQAEQFKATIQPALQAALDALTQSRETVTSAVAVLAGEETAATPMGSEPSAFGAEAPSTDTMNAAPDEDEFATSDAAAGGAETAGREMREHRLASKVKRIIGENSIMRKLAG